MSEPLSRSISRRGRTLKLDLADGTSSGVIIAELGISSVRAAVASCTALPELIRREEAPRTVVYLLVGPDPNLPGRQLAYVGEGDGVLAPAGDNTLLRYSANAAFDSPSGAAGAVRGGNRHWRHATTDQSFGDWRKSRIGDGGIA